LNLGRAWWHKPEWLQETYLVSLSVQFRSLLCLTLLSTLLLGCAATTPVGKAKHLLAMDQQAQGYYQSGDYTNALEAYQFLAKEMKTEARYWYFVGNCYARLERPDEAVQAYREALVRRPDDAKAWHNLILVEAKLLSKSMAEMSQAVPADNPLMKKVDLIHQRLNGVVFGEK